MTGVSRVLMSSAVLLATCFGVAFSADSPIDRGSVVLTGSASFTSQGGDLYASEGHYDDYGNPTGGGGDRLNSFTLQSTIGGFVSKGFNLGGAFALQSASQGGDSYTLLGIGPKVAYFFGANAIDEQVKGSTIPVVGASFLYRSISGGGDTATGTSFSFSGGIVHMVTRSVALDVEAVYQIDTFESVGGNTIGVLAGLGFFIWE